jgi:hypothetical protein
MSERKRIKTVKVREEAHHKLKSLAAINKISIEELLEKLLNEHLDKEIFKITEFTKTGK